MKKLLVSVIRYLVADASVQSGIAVVVRITGRAGLGVGQRGEHRPLAQFQHLRFEAGLPVLGLSVAVALAAAALLGQALRRGTVGGIAPELLVDFFR
ncbi:hypothetical protein [Hymenobacter piscis]|uniref:hypothetical protein n=1 Tax=Hymenobacter piscis TaxID=2839984 RepID=UPI001FEBAE91|nr:hypothetical protein [Hymenobacter piscis]